MKKLLVSALLCLALATACVLPASAESFAGSEGWRVGFDGSKMNSNFKTGAMSEEISKMQPGDDVTFSVALSNDSPYATEWYMTNKVLKSLEESQSVAKWGAYTYRLTYTDAAGNRSVLYDSDSIGGTKTTAAGVGLHEATDSLKDYFYLDEVTPGAHGQVDLAVSLEGDTQGNAYQDTLAQLQMNFAVELSDTVRGKVPPSGSNVGGAPTPTPRVRYVYRTNIPQTYDDMNLSAITIVCGASGLALLAIVLLRLRKAKKKKDGDKPDDQ